jgi:hypothetical protein
VQTRRWWIPDLKGLSGPGLHLPSGVAGGSIRQVSNNGFRYQEISQYANWLYLWQHSWDARFCPARARLHLAMDVTTDVWSRGRFKRKISPISIW